MVFLNGCITQFRGITINCIINDKKVNYNQEPSSKDFPLLPNFVTKKIAGKMRIKIMKGNILKKKKTSEMTTIT